MTATVVWVFMIFFQWWIHDFTLKSVTFFRGGVGGGGCINVLINFIESLQNILFKYLLQYVDKSVIANRASNTNLAI